MTIDEETFHIFQKVGKEILIRNLGSSHSGNISIRSGGKIIIKKRAAMLGWLEPEDLIECGLEKDDSSSLLASTELGVHRAIYLQTDAMAVVHTHSPYSVVLSMIEDEITCIDAEGVFLYKKVPVVELNVPSGSSEAGREGASFVEELPCMHRQESWHICEGNHTGRCSSECNRGRILGTGSISYNADGPAPEKRLQQGERLRELVTKTTESRQ